MLSNNFFCVEVRDISAWSVAMRQPMIDVYGEATFEKIWHDWVDIFFEMPKQPDGTIDLYKKVMLLQ